jgi:hypothetical protein
VTENATTAAAAGRPRPRSRSLYRRVLSLAVAAVFAACLPFSIFYIGALQHRGAIVTTVAAPGGGGHTRLVTTTSGARQKIAATGSAAAAPGSPAPVTTRVS